MRKILKILAIVVVLVLAGTYLIYVLDYKGNYNLATTITLNIDDTGSISLTEFDYDVEPTSAIQFWDLFRGGGSEPGEATYKVYWELNYSGISRTERVYRTLAPGESAVLDTQFNNIPAGDASLKITVLSWTNTYLYSKSYSVVVG